MLNYYWVAKDSDFKAKLTEKLCIINFCLQFSGDAHNFSLSWVLHKKDKKAKNMLDNMEVYLNTKTYLAGERITLADISLAMTYLPMYQYVMDAKTRSKYPNNTRWFNTCIHQPNFLKVLGNVKLCEKKWFYLINAILMKKGLIDYISHILVNFGKIGL